MAVLRCFQDHPTLSVSQVSRLLGLSPATAHRLLRALVEADLVGQDPATSRYQLGAGLAAAGALASRRLGYEAARPELDELARTLGFSVTLGVNEGTQSLTVETAVTHADDAVPVMPGVRTPIYACAMGKSISAYDPASPNLETELFREFTPNTIKSPARLRLELETVRAQGWAMNNEEFFLGVRGLAVPIRDKQGKVIAAVAIAATTPHLTDRSVEHATVAVKASAQRLGTLLSPA